MEATTEGLAQLATVLFPSRFVGKRLLCMLVAYFDESGTHAESPIIAVAGFLAPQERWIEYEAKWAHVLEKWGLSVFHMAEYENRQGPYAALTNPDRIELLGSLIEIIAATAWVGISVALVKADYAAIRDAENVTFGSEYGLCANDCIRLLNKWLNVRGIRERIAYVCELGPLGATDLQRAFEHAYATDPDRFHLQSLHFVSKTQYAQLQAADFLAYETPKQVLRRVGRDSRELRKSLEKLLRRVPVESNLLDARNLPDYVAKARAWKREHGTNDASS